MADIAPLVTIEDYRRALDATLNALEEVLSTDPHMPSHVQTIADADQWLDACRSALDEAKRRSP
jgi:hypothetical protein